MSTDSITEEIRAFRHKLAAQFGNDLSRILADVRQREASDPRTYVTLPRRLPRAQMASQADEREPLKADRFEGRCYWLRWSDHCGNAEVLT